MTKTEKVLEHLKTKGSITSWEAITLYRATRLSAIIFNLRETYDIETVRHIATDDNGVKYPYAEYIFKGEH